MNILVTGASGFLGQYVVAELLRRGHSVRLGVRSSTDLTRFSWQHHPGIQRVNLDLANPDLANPGKSNPGKSNSGNPAQIAETLQSVDAVIHLAAAKGGDFQTQMAGTVAVTEHLLQAMQQAGVMRLVAISTFSVYDYLHLPTGSAIDEHSPIEPHPSERDGYAQTKLIQEQQVREFEQEGGQVTIIRPGMVYGRDALWNACLGAKAGNRIWLRIGADGTLPLTYVENCASAIVNAVERTQAIGQTVNVVDDDLPSQSVYANKLLQRMDAAPQVILIPWSVMAVVADGIGKINKTLFASRLKLPGLLIPARLHARFKPLRYTNLRAKQVLDWTPQYSLDDAFERSGSDLDLLAVPDGTLASNQSSSLPLP